jgi:hypothetical protein
MPTVAAVNPTAKYAHWTASSVAALGAVPTLVDQTGNLRNMTQPIAVNQPVRAVAVNGGVSTPVLRVNGTQGWLDQPGKRALLPSPADWTKMVVFVHNAAADLNTMSNYMSAWQPNAASTLWRNSNFGVIQTTSTHGNITMQVGSTLTPTAGKWYIIFQTYTGATRSTDFYANIGGSIQKITAAGSNILPNAMTATDVELGLLILSGNIAGPICDCLEAATWNSSLSVNAMIAEQQRMVNANPTLIWNN